MRSQTPDGAQTDISPAMDIHPARTHCCPGQGDSTILALSPLISILTGPSRPSTMKDESMPRPDSMRPEGLPTVTLEALPGSPPPTAKRIAAITMAAARSMSPALKKG